MAERKKKERKEGGGKRAVTAMGNPAKKQKTQKNRNQPKGGVCVKDWLDYGEVTLFIVCMISSYIPE